MRSAYSLVKSLIIVYEELNYLDFKLFLTTEPIN
jgi:hypothetical protein